MTTIDELFRKTQDAYSFNAYGARGWQATIGLLSRRGYNDKQVEEIMRSKHTRWAHDASDRPYGRMTGRAFRDYMDKYPRYFHHFTSLYRSGRTPRGNPYGYGLTTRELDALRWAMERGSGTYFLTGPGLTRYKGMDRRAPTKLVGSLLDKGMVYRDHGRSLVADLKEIEVYSLTARAVHALAQNGGYKTIRMPRTWVQRKVRGGS